MKYFVGKGFERILKKLHPNIRLETQRKIDIFVRTLEAGQVPIGLGIKKIKEELWEFRITLSIRILFQWNKKSVIFLFLGSHNEVQQFLKHYNPTPI